MLKEYLLPEQKKQIEQVINSSLDRADRFWSQSGSKLEESQLALESIVMDSAISSNLPNHESINPQNSINQEMIAIVVDMRKSTEHAKSQFRDFNPLRRIFCETSALLPAIEQTILFENGRVTEYLGDGVLGFFALNKNDENDKNKVIHSVSKTAKRIIVDVREMVNDAISHRYGLPKDIYLGVGLAYSQTIIHATGLPTTMHAKAFGECVYDATKLSSGTNIIGVSDNLKAIWPEQPGGKNKLVRHLFEKSGIKGYKLDF